MSRSRSAVDEVPIGPSINVTADGDPVDGYPLSGAQLDQMEAYVLRSSAPLLDTVRARALVATQAVALARREQEERDRLAREEAREAERYQNSRDTAEAVGQLFGLELQPGPYPLRLGPWGFEYPLRGTRDEGGNPAGQWGTVLFSFFCAVCGEVKAQGNIKNLVELGRQIERGETELCWTCAHREANARLAESAQTAAPEPPPEPFVVGYRYVGGDGFLEVAAGVWRRGLAVTGVNALPPTCGADDVGRPYRSEVLCGAAGGVHSPATVEQLFEALQILCVGA